MKSHRDGPPAYWSVEWGTEAPVHQQGARHDVDALRQSRGLPGLRFEGAVHGVTASYRRIGRYADEAVLDRMAERLADRPGVLHRRREFAERGPIWNHPQRGKRG